MLPTVGGNGYETWVSRVGSLICIKQINGFEQVWLFGCGDEYSFVKETIEILHISFCYIWLNHIESSNRFANYQQFKHFLEQGDYINLIWMSVHRNALAQFRMGVSLIKPTNADIRKNQKTETVHFVQICLNQKCIFF